MEGRYAFGLENATQLFLEWTALRCSSYPLLANQLARPGLRLSPALHRPGCTLCVVESFWRGRPRSRARPCSRLCPCRSRARPCSRAPPLSSSPPSPHAGHWVPALPWDALRSRGLQHSGPHLFEDLCALVTPDSLNTITGDQRIEFLWHLGLYLFSTIVDAGQVYDMYMYA